MSKTQEEFEAALDQLKILATSAGLDPTEIGGALVLRGMSSLIHYGGVDRALKSLETWIDVLRIRKAETNDLDKIMAEFRVSRPTKGSA